MSNPVDRIARVIYTTVEFRGVSWEALKSEEDQRSKEIMARCRSLALEILEEMREPTEAMLMAPGVPYGGKVLRDVGLKARKQGWHAMIDEAMK